MLKFFKTLLSKLLSWFKVSPTHPTEQVIVNTSVEIAPVKVEVEIAPEDAISEKDEVTKVDEKPKKRRGRKPKAKPTE